jgi:hypothetical protein
MHYSALDTLNDLKTIPGTALPDPHFYHGIGAGL